MSQYRYHLGNNILNYEECEKDLRIIVNSNFSWLDHQSLVTSKASQMLGLTKRTCHFLTNINRKRARKRAKFVGYLKSCKKTAKYSCFDRQIRHQYLSNANF